MRFTKTHIAFIISGIVLAVACMLLSGMDCIVHTHHNGWTMETTTQYIGFEPGCFIFCGLAEIILLLFRNRILRTVAMLVSLVKIVLPWLAINLRNALGSSMMDASFQYRISNPIPYVVTALAVLLLIQMIVMFFVLGPKKQTTPQ